MNILIAGSIIFVLVHLLPSFEGLRLSVIKKAGIKPYRIVFSLVSLLSLILIGIGKSQAEFQMIWPLQAWSKSATLILMYASVCLIVSAYMPSNIKRFTRHPMLWGVTLWSLAHLISNGDIASIILFGTFGLYSLFDMYSSNRRGAVKSEEIRPIKNDFIVIAVALFIYIALAFLHPHVIGTTIY